MLSFQKVRQDYTAFVAAATHAVEVQDESEYPSDPKINDAVYDASEGAVKLWDGEGWVACCTRAGAKK